MGFPLKVQLATAFLHLLSRFQLASQEGCYNFRLQLQLLDDKEGPVAHSRGTELSGLPAASVIAGLEVEPFK